LPYPEIKPALSSFQGGELRLSGDGFRDLVWAILAKGKPVRFQVRGFSMSPFLREGDVVTLRPVGERPLCRGDIAAFFDSSSGKMAVHRIVSADRKSGRFLFKGDNSPAADGFVDASDIYGIIGRVERRGKTVRLGIGPGRGIVAWLSQRIPLTRWLFFLKRLVFVRRKSD